MADMEIGTFTPAQTRELWQWYQQAKQLNPQLQQNFPNRKAIDEPSPHRIFVKNESGEEIPAYGCMQVTGTVTESGRVFLSVTKPNTICGEYIFNSQFPIAIGEYGWGYAFGIVRMLGAVGSYSSCKRYGATSGSWTISQNDGGFLVYGDDGEKTGVAIGRIVGDHCKADMIKFTYSSGASTPVTVNAAYNGINPSSCGDVDVVYPLGQPCTDGVEVIADYDQNTGNYVARDTINSMLGEPETKDVLITSLTSTGGTCDIGYTKQSMRVITCDSTPVAGSVAISTTPVEVLTNITDTGTDITTTKRNVYVCGFGGEFAGDPILTTTCSDCTESCVWRWVYDNLDWEVFTACPNGCDCGPKPALPNPLPTSSLDVIDDISVPCATPDNTYNESGALSLVIGLGI